MPGVGRSLSVEIMTSSILEKYGYNVKDCRYYIMEQYLAADDAPDNQYWLEVGCDVERKIELQKVKIHRT
jgi:hypothetical protein